MGCPAVENRGLQWTDKCVMVEKNEERDEALERLSKAFFARDPVTVARELVGKQLVFQTPEGIKRLRITEAEAYWGEEDTACHAHKGRTKRTEVMYGEAGTIYVYLCYGMHWMLNLVTGDREDPQAVLIRACQGAEGPGRLTKAMGITGVLNGKSAVEPGSRLWVEDDGLLWGTEARKRVGIGYAAPEDRDRLWRFVKKP